MLFVAFAVLGLVACLPYLFQEFRWSGVREAARRTKCANNCRLICLGLESYRHEHGAFPPAYIADANGKPLHSWRVLILPYVEEQALFDRYDFDEPWDGPKNIKLLAEIPDIYRCPSHEYETSEIAGKGFTNYLLLTGEETVFPGSQVVANESISDGPENTLILADVNHLSVEWLRPQDLPAVTFRKNLLDRNYVSNHPNSLNDDYDITVCGFANCDVVSLSGDTLTPATLNAMTTAAQGDKVNLNE